MTYPSARSDARPVAPSPVQGPPQLIIERDFHAHTLAMFCYAGKHQSASKGLHTDGMEEPLSATFARNLRDRMLALGMTQQELARKSGVAQTTISLYLHPQRRPTGASGIDPSPTRPYSLWRTRCAAPSPIARDPGNSQSPRRHPPAFHLAASGRTAASFVRSPPPQSRGVHPSDMGTVLTPAPTTADE